jgi:hypothetical protein
VTCPGSLVDDTSVKSRSIITERQAVGYLRPNPKRFWATLRIWISSLPSVIR